MLERQLLFVEAAALSALQDVLTALLPALLELCRDPVAAVRLAAGGELGTTVASFCQRVATSEDAASGGSIAAAVAGVCQLAGSPAFQHRQVYAHAFARMARAMPPGTVLQYFWPAFVSLASDGVSNVRLAVVHTLLSLVSPQIGNGTTDLCLQSHEAAAVFVTHPPVHEMALEMEQDSDQEVARLARRVVSLLGDLQR